MENVSVILSVRNGEKYLAEALNSALSQTYPIREILVIDGGSTDRSPEIAKSFPKVKVLAQEGRGIPAANNQGIRAANGDWVAFLEADDRWLPQKLEKQMFGFEPGRRPSYSVTRFRFFREPGSAVPACFKNSLFEGDHVGRIMSTLVAKKSLFEEVGYFDATYHCAGDVDWFARAKDLHGPPSLVEESLMEKRIHESNFSNLALVNNREMLRAMKDSVERRRRG
ncbi:MAG TPA: glycosyltransferase [bacterium]|nr:glycosyltransferase [bacterium]